jgi:glycerol-3-phosphate acyltransferase PlsY
MPVFDTPFFALLIVAAGGYLLGSVPFGPLVARLMGLPDPRTIGSGNIGATNMLRTGSKAAALATVLLDGAKGLVAVLLARAFAGDDAAQLAALAAFLGHCFSGFLRFRGGKGVATFLGALYGLTPVLGVAASVIWLLTAFLFRYSSLSALVSAALTPFVAWLAGYGQMMVVTGLMAAVLIWRHRENIARLRAGTEGKVGSGKT